MLQQEPGLVSEAKTKTYDIHAQEPNDIRGIKSATKHCQKTGKKKTYVGIAWVNVKSLHN